VRRQLAAVGELCQRIVVREMMQLPGPLGDVMLELRLVSAQLASACAMRSAMC